MVYSTLHNIVICSGFAKHVLSDVAIVSFLKEYSIGKEPEESAREICWQYCRAEMTGYML